MFKPLAAQFIQHLSNQNNWSRQHLMHHAGKVIALHIAFVQTKLMILPDGSLDLAADNAHADASIDISPSLALRLMAKDDAAKLHIKVEGDAHLATELGKVLQYMRWDIEEDLSKVVGDIPAHQLSHFGKQSVGTVKKQAANLAAMLVEYWQEEMPLLAKKWQVEQFNADVDYLRSDFARLDKKLAKLTQRIQESISH